MIIQEDRLAVTELLCGIADGAQIKRIGGSVEALDTRKIQPQELYSAVITS